MTVCTHGRIDGENVIDRVQVQGRSKCGAGLRDWLGLGLGLGLALINIWSRSDRGKYLTITHAIKNMNDRDHITPIGRPAALQTRPTTYVMLQCQCLSMSTADCRWCPDTTYAGRRGWGARVGLGVGSWSNSSSSSMLARRSGETRWDGSRVHWVWLLW